MLKNVSISTTDVVRSDAITAPSSSISCSPAAASLSLADGRWTSMKRLATDDSDPGRITRREPAGSGA